MDEARCQDLTLFNKKQNVVIMCVCIDVVGVRTAEAPWIKHLHLNETYFDTEGFGGKSVDVVEKNECGSSPLV